MYASALGIKEFREGGYEGEIGIVHSFTPVNGVDDRIETKIAMRYADNYCNNWILDTAAKGEIPIDLLSELSKQYDISYMKPEQLKIIKEKYSRFSWVKLLFKNIGKTLYKWRNNLCCE